MHNLATATYVMYGNASVFIEWGKLKIYIGINADNMDRPKTFACIEQEGEVIGQIDLELDYFDEDVWQRENFLLYLLTHHADELAQFDIGYIENMEAVELPHNLTTYGMPYSPAH